MLESLVVGIVLNLVTPTQPTREIAQEKMEAAPQAGMLYQLEAQKRQAQGEYRNAAEKYPVVINWE